VANLKYSQGLWHANEVVTDEGFNEAYFGIVILPRVDFMVATETIEEGHDLCNPWQSRESCPSLVVKSHT
jgi:hypothetical protein